MFGHHIQTKLHRHLLILLAMALTLSWYCVEANAAPEETPKTDAPTQTQEGPKTETAPQTKEAAAAKEAPQKGADSQTTAVPTEIVPPTEPTGATTKTDTTTKTDATTKTDTTNATTKTDTTSKIDAATEDEEKPKPEKPKPKPEPEVANREYELGMEDFQKKLYRSAAKHFQASVDKDPDALAHCIRRLQVAHSWAALKELDKAIPAYQDVMNCCFGAAEHKIAKDCMAKLQPSTKLALGPGVLSRITLLAPIDSRNIAKHPPVSPKYIDLIKTTLQSLPPAIRKSIDESTCTITIGPNIVDRWPDAGDEIAPGKTTKLSQDIARTYGMDVYIWERPLVSGPGNIKTLGPIFPDSLVKLWIYTQVGHVVCEIEGVNEDPLLIDAYRQDCEGIPEFQKDNPSVRFYTRQKRMGPGEVAAAVIENLLQNRKGHVQDLFPRCFDWTKHKFKL